MGEWAPALPGVQDLTDRGWQRLLGFSKPEWLELGWACGVGGGVAWPLGPCRIRCERPTSDEMRGYSSFLSWELCQAKKAMLHVFFFFFSPPEFTILYQGKGGELSLSNL